MADRPHDGDILYASESNTMFNIAPIGSITAWLKTYTNTPSLPANWVECNGQTLSDADSVYNGQVIPDLNGDNRFLRGSSTSGGTGGSATHEHSTPIAFRGTGELEYGNALFGTTADQVPYSHYQADATNLSTGSAQDCAATSTNNAEPPYYAVVWIMRIK